MSFEVMSFFLQGERRLVEDFDQSPLFFMFGRLGFWKNGWGRRDLNPQPSGYEPPALTLELRPLGKVFYCIYKAKRERIFILYCMHFCFVFSHRGGSWRER